MPSLVISVVAGSMDGRRLDGIFVAAVAAVAAVVCFASSLNFNLMDYIFF